MKPARGLLLTMGHAVTAVTCGAVAPMTHLGAYSARFHPQVLSVRSSAADSGAILSGYLSHLSPA